MFSSLLQLSMMRAEHQHEIGRITSDLEDETCSRFDMDKRLADLRKEVSDNSFVNLFQASALNQREMRVFSPALV